MSFSRSPAHASVGCGWGSDDTTWDEGRGIKACRALISVDDESLEGDQKTVNGGEANGTVENAIDKVYKGSKSITWYDAILSTPHYAATSQRLLQLLYPQAHGNSDLVLMRVCRMPDH